MNRPPFNVGYSQEEGHRESSFCLREILYVLFRRKIQMVLFFFLTLAIGVTLAKSVTLTYQSQATLFLKPSRELESIDPANPESRYNIRADTLMRSEMEILGSEALAELIVEKVGADQILAPYLVKDSHTTALSTLFKASPSSDTKHNTPSDTTGAPPPEKQTGNGPVELSSDAKRLTAVRIVRGSLHASARETLISLTYTGPTPTFAQDLLRAAMDAYEERRVEVYRVSPDLFQKQTEKVRSQLEETEQQLQKQLAELGVFSFEEERSLLIGNLGELKQALTESEIIISASQARIEGFQEIAELRQMGFTVDESEDTFAYYMNQNLTDLLRQEADLSSRYPDNAVPLRNVREQIARIQEALASHAATAPGSESSFDPQTNDSTGTTDPDTILALVQMKSEIARREGCKRAIREITLRLGQLEANDLSVRRLQRRQETLEVSYSNHLANLEKVKINAALDKQTISNISVIQSPTKPLNADKTMRTRVLAFSIFFAFFGSLGFPFLLHFLDHSLKTAEDIESHLNLRVLATLPYCRYHRIQADSTDRFQLRSKPLFQSLFKRQRADLLGANQVATREELI